MAGLTRISLALRARAVLFRSGPRFPQQNDFQKEDFMMTDITTGEQTATTTGALTGSLDTSGLTGKWGVKLRFSLTAGVAIVALQDTASSTPFSDAVDIAVFEIKGQTATEGRTVNKQDYEIPDTRFGGPNTKLRFSVLSIEGGGTLTAYGWLEQ